MPDCLKLDMALKYSSDSYKALLPDVSRCLVLLLLHNLHLAPRSQADFSIWLTITCAMAVWLRGDAVVSVSINKLLDIKLDTGISNHLQVINCLYVMNHTGQLSLAIHLWTGAKKAGK